MANGSTRARAWSKIPDQKVVLDLVVNELDEFDGSLKTLVTDINLRLVKIERRSSWILGIFVGILVALVANLAILVLLPT